MELPRPLELAQRAPSLDGLTLDLSPVFTPTPPILFAVMTAPTVMGVLFCATWLPTMLVAVGAGMSDEPALAVSILIASVTAAVLGMLVHLPLITWTARQQVGLILRFSRHRLHVERRARGGRTIRSIAFSEVRDVRSSGHTLVLVTRSGQIEVPLPDRSRATRHALVAYLTETISRASVTGGSAHEVPEALRHIVRQRQSA